MISLVESGGRLRQWDPLFRAVFDNQDDIIVTVTPVRGGINVKLVGSTGCAVEVVKSHADVVSAFISDGYEALHETHEDPC